MACPNSLIALFPHIRLTEPSTRATTGIAAGTALQTNATVTAAAKKRAPLMTELAAPIFDESLLQGASDATVAGPALSVNWDPRL